MSKGSGGNWGLVQGALGGLSSQDVATSYVPQNVTPVIERMLQVVVVLHCCDCKSLALQILNRLQSVIGCSHWGRATIKVPLLDHAPCQKRLSWETSLSHT